MNKKLRKYSVICFLLSIIFPNLYLKSQDLYLPFVDDFSSYSGSPDKHLWEKSNCLVNDGYQFFPPGVGVVTFDVLDSKGNIYPFADIYPFAADTLCSLPIRLDSVKEPVLKKLYPSDSIYMSFYIQPGGAMGQLWEKIGSAPGVNDSIVLQFYSSFEDKWNTVWSMKGTCVDSIYTEDSAWFKYIMVPIDDVKYFTKDFRFRFYNYGSLLDSSTPEFVSNCDQWNIDYIYININRSYSDKTFRDIAFVNPAPSLLNRYSAMPYNQFDQTDLKDSLDMTVINLHSVALSSRYHYSIEEENGNRIYYYDGGVENIEAFNFNHKFQSSPNHCRPPVEVDFGILNRDRQFTVTHIVSEGTGQDNVYYNDTVRFVQKFENYFAYDDGTSEDGFGVEPVKGSELALGFNLKRPDTVYAVDIYFNNSYQDKNLQDFYISLWSAYSDSVAIPYKCLYKSDRITPKRDSLNIFTRYYLQEPQRLDKGEFFVSVQPHNKSYLNIGFDKNNDASPYTFIKVSNQWQQVFNKGAIMLRPYFGYKTVGLNGVNENTNMVNIWPNPANNIVNVSFNGNSAVEIIDMTGRRVKKSYDKTIDVSDLYQGMYLIKVAGQTKKLIIRR